MSFLSLWVARSRVSRTRQKSNGFCLAPETQRNRRPLRAAAQLSSTSDPREGRVKRNTVGSPGNGLALRRRTRYARRSPRRHRPHTRRALHAPWTDLCNERAEGVGLSLSTIPVARSTSTPERTTMSETYEEPTPVEPGIPSEADTPTP